MHTSTIRRCAAAVLFGLAIGCTAVQAAEQLSPEVGTPLQAAQALMKAQKYKDALARIDEADKVSGKSDYEAQVISRMRGTVDVQLGDADGAARAFGVVLAGKDVPADEQQKIMQALAAVYFRAKDYPTAVSWVERYEKAGGSDATMQQLHAQALYLSGDYAAAAKLLDAQLQAADKAGRPASEDSLKLLGSCYANLKDDARYADVLARLIELDPKKEYWSDLLSRVQRQPGMGDRQMLDVYRLMQALGLLTQASDYMEMAQLSIQAGYPGEAQKIIAAGYAAKLLGSGPDAERHKRLDDMARRKAADDQKGGSADPAKDAALDANTLVNEGFNEVLNGRYDSGIPRMEKAIAKGGLKYPQDAQLHLGLAYLYAGRKAEALRTLKPLADSGNEGAARLARLWTLQARHA